MGSSNAFPDGSAGKESACNAGDAISILGEGFKMPWRRKWQSTPVFLPGKFHGQTSLVGYSPWGHMTERTGAQMPSEDEDFRGHFREYWNKRIRISKIHSSIK